MATKNYRRVIIQLEREHDWRKLVFIIASKAPKLVLDVILEAHKMNHVPPPDFSDHKDEVKNSNIVLTSLEITEDVRNILQTTTTPVPAIKYVREKMGCGLREAKYFVNEVRRNML